MYKPTAEPDTVYRVYEKSRTTGTVYVDPSAAYDTVNHRLLLTKLYGMTEDAEFTKLIGSMICNRRFYVELNGKKSRWRNQKMVYFKGVFTHPCYSLSIQTTSLYTMRHAVSYMLTTYVQPHNVVLLSRQKPSLLKYYRIWTSTMKGMTFVQILTPQESRSKQEVEYHMV